MKFDKKLLKTWNIVVIAAIVAGLYFLHSYFGVIIVAAIMAFLFNPVYRRFFRHYKRPGISASLTFLVSLLTIIIPLVLILIVIVLQTKSLLKTLSGGPTIDVDTLGQSALTAVNNFLSHFPGAHTVSSDDVAKAVNQALSNAAGKILSIVTGSIGGISRAITMLIIYIYLFVNILMHQDTLIEILKKINPLGREMSETYLQKMGSMTIAMGKGQFIIAFMQGVESSIVLYLVGFHSLFMFFLIFLSFLSLIPLGAGIVTIPLGVGLILIGDYWQGAVVLANHLLVVTNIDNVVRPRLVPKTASLNSALTILSVFAGVGIFGFFGIIIGPVIMIVLVTTIKTYLEVQAKAAAERA